MHWSLLQVSNSPPHPYADLASLEYPPVEGRILLGFLTYLHRADGFLYWHVNNWRGESHPLMDESKCYFGVMASAHETAQK